MLHTILFYAFGAAAVLSALAVITRRNPVNSAVSLLATFASVAALFILMNAPFIAMVQITVYAGAILVLILFTIMLLNLTESGSGLFDITSSAQRIAAILIVAALAAELVFVYVRYFGKVEPRVAVQPQAVEYAAGNTQMLGRALFSTYVWPFEVVSVLLVVAIIGAVVLTRKRDGGTVSVLFGDEDESK